MKKAVIAAVAIAVVGLGASAGSSAAAAKRATAAKPTTTKVVAAAGATTSSAATTTTSKPAVAPGQIKNITNGSNGNANGIVNGIAKPPENGFGYGFQKRDVSPS